MRKHTEKKWLEKKEVYYLIKKINFFLDYYGYMDSQNEIKKIKNTLRHKYFNYFYGFSMKKDTRKIINKSNRLKYKNKIRKEIKGDKTDGDFNIKIKYWY
jgi:hypothetical protein